MMIVHKTYSLSEVQHKLLFVLKSNEQMKIEFKKTQFQYGSEAFNFLQ